MDTEHNKTEEPKFDAEQSAFEEWARLEMSKPSFNILLSEDGWRYSSDDIQVAWLA